METEIILNKSQLVRETCQWVLTHSQHVSINHSNIDKIQDISYTPFDAFEHHRTADFRNEQQYLNFLFALDAMNFCFWPNPKIEYDFLASRVREATLSGVLAVDSLPKVTEQTLLKQVFKNDDIPLADERARLLRELGRIVNLQFNGSFSSIIHSARKSAVRLLHILTSSMCVFQDHAIYKGHQIHFYKRAQILIGDIYAHFGGQGLGAFQDIHELTMFADYRVPQILREWGILEYSEQLAAKVDAKIQLENGREEVEIRAATVLAVEAIKNNLKEKYNKVYTSIEIDWFLWEYGETHLKDIKPHHRVLTIYY